MYRRRSSSASCYAVASACPHTLQNLLPDVAVALQLGHVIVSALPQFEQKDASDSFSCWQTVQIIWPRNGGTGRILGSLELRCGE